MFTLSTGQYIEKLVKEIFEDMFPNTYREATEEEDLHQGTDFFVSGVPIDVTLDENKNYTKFIKKYMLEGITINVMIRYRNAFSRFDKPVLVFQFETYENRDRFDIADMILENLTVDIVSEIIGLYKFRR